MSLLPLHTSRLDEMATLLWMCGVGGIGDSAPVVQRGWYFLSFKHVTFEEKVPSTRQCLKLQALKEVLYISSSLEGVL